MNLLFRQQESYTFALMAPAIVLEPFFFKLLIQVLSLSYLLVSQITVLLSIPFLFLRFVLMFKAKGFFFPSPYVTKFYLDHVILCSGMFENNYEQYIKSDSATSSIKSVSHVRILK